MAQWLKHLLYKHENLRSSPRNPYKAGHGSTRLLSLHSADTEGSGLVASSKPAWAP